MNKLNPKTSSLEPLLHSNIPISEEATNSTKLFRNKNFMILWGGLIISQFGDVLFFTAIISFAYKISESSTTVATALVISGIPRLLLAPIAGSIIDKIPLRPLLFITCVARGICSVIIPTVSSPEWFYILIFITSILDLFYLPVLYTILPEIVPKQELIRVNSLTGFSFRLMQILGGLGFSALFILFDYTIIFLVDATTFWVFAIFVFFLNLHPKKQQSNSQENTNKPPNFVKELLNTVSMLRGERIILLSILVFVMNSIVIASVNTLMPTYAQDYLSSGEQGLGLLFAMRGFGALMCMLLMTILGDRIKQTTLISYALFIVGLTFLGLSTIKIFLIAAVLFFIEGFLGSILTIIGRVLQQGQVIREKRGKIISLSMSVSQAVYVSTASLAGIIAAQQSVTFVFSGVGIILLLFSLTYMTSTSPTILTSSSSE